MQGKVWLYSGMAGWHFVTLPRKQSKEIEDLYSGILKRGWRSLQVTVIIGTTSWNTSIFPDKKSGTYMLPPPKQK
ncbi:DUF1905 domain-containing protein [Patescibacteria group bacterium]|nr:DUF1905 domain-containing protein [Patescibacteria group bacterium]